MQVITIEDSAFKAIEGMVSNILNVVTAQNEEIKHLKDNRLMSIDEVSAYLGFGSKWIHQRKDLIGFFQDGKDIKMYKADVDAYITKNFIKRKY